MNAIKNFIADEAGVTAIEYALLAAGIAVIVGTAAATLGGNIKTVFNTIAGKLTVST